MTPLQTIIEDFEAKNLIKFKPQRQFYETVGINRVRFAMLSRGEKTLSVDEAKKIAIFFNVPINNLIN